MWLTILSEFTLASLYRFILKIAWVGSPDLEFESILYPDNLEDHGNHDTICSFRALLKTLEASCMLRTKARV